MVLYGSWHEAPGCTIQPFSRTALQPYACVLLSAQSERWHSPVLSRSEEEQQGHWFSHCKAAFLENRLCCACWPQPLRVAQHRAMPTSDSMGVGCFLFHHVLITVGFFPYIGKYSLNLQMTSSALLAAEMLVCENAAEWLHIISLMT